MCKLRALLGAAAISILASSVLADSSPIVASDAWARPTLAGTRTGAVYLMLSNRGSAPDHLVGVSTPVADRAELHEDMTENGMMSMKPVPDLALAPGGSAAIEPGRYHIMLIGMRKSVNVGESFPITLTFATAPPLEVTVAVTRTPPKSASATPGSMPMKMP
jgi:copper(I)-binding protein